MFIDILKLFLAGVVFPLLLWLLWRGYLKKYFINLFAKQDEEEKNRTDYIPPKNYDEK